jgi:hypothetical protein
MAVKQAEEFVGGAIRPAVARLWPRAQSKRTADAGHLLDTN